MNTSLLSIGKRNAELHEKTLTAAKAIGKVEVDHGDNSCQVLDIAKHLTSDYVLKKFGKN